MCIIHWMMLIVQYKNDKWASAQREYVLELPNAKN